MAEVYAPVCLSVQTGECTYAWEGQILILGLPRDWQGFKYSTLSSWGHQGSLCGKTDKKVAGPAESGSSQSVGLARKILKVNLLYGSAILCHLFLHILYQNLLC